LIILQLESSPGWGGQEIRILNEALGMRKRGHEIIFALTKSGGLAKEAKKNNFLVYELNYKKIFWLYAFFLLLVIIIKNKVDVINTHSSNDAWLGGILGRICRRKIIRTRHLSTRIKKGLNSILLYNFLTDWVVTTSQCVVPMICKQSKIKPQRCLSIPTGLDEKKAIITKDEIDQFLEPYKIDKNDFLVGTACFMRSWKGIDDFIYAANSLKDRLDIKWLIIGGGHEKKYRELARDLHLEKTVFFTGHLQNPLAAIASLDVFALLSTAHEGVSQASLQAAFLQKPIIGTPVGGIPEVCIHEQTGLIVPTFSPKEVVKAVLEIKASREKKETMGKNAKELVLKKFTYEEMLDKMEKIYQN
jgi:glycosyltransferase involved in cell wall biosynthesis